MELNRGLATHAPNKQTLPVQEGFFTRYANKNKKEKDQQVDLLVEAIKNAEADCERIVIYNPADIDSTLAAAFLMARLLKRGKAKAYPASNKVPLKKFNEYHWVGVEPKKATLKDFGRSMIHCAYIADPSRLFRGHTRVLTHLSSGDFVQHALDCTDFVQLPCCTLNAVFGHDIPQGPAWMVTQLVYRYMHGDKTMPLIDQATVYLNYNNAIQMLNSGMDDFSFMFASEKHIQIYLDFLKTIKRQLATLFEYTSFKIDGHFQRVPLINVNQSMSPWVMKLLSESYDFAVTYEQRRGRSIYTVFSRIAGFDNLILRQIANNPTVAGFSYQL